ncbi:unnamed protein product [Euphydryas editha]|uniref:LIM zinc-binding domain-containing protein n=1 Tax=Euphydryas editha TaxID=104508 RepID=A0AAU9U6P9_EUPED|nr:unnamed protein product [Euphydryas editha]
MEGPNSREIISCACCLNDIGDEDYVSALGQEWHKDCFRCSECDAQLTTWYFEKNGMLFCQADYWARYGDNCQQCGQVITGPVMAAGEHRFHPECFSCDSCGAPLEDTEPYALLERSELYCGACYAECVRRGRRDVHAVRVLRAPSHALRLAPAAGALLVADGRCAAKLRGAARALLRAALRACLQLACRRIDPSIGMLTLHIGDKVLEVNGTPVQNTPLSEIERVLARPEIIQLTIEHNPDTINAKRGTSDTQKQSDDDRYKPEKEPPVEKKIFKKDLKLNIPKLHSDEGKSKEDIIVRRERLFKRKGEDGGKVRVIKKRQVPSSPLLGDKEKSSSMSKLLDAVEGDEVDGVLGDLSRARSFRTEAASGQKVFRASDLLQQRCTVPSWVDWEYFISVLTGFVLTIPVSTPAYVDSTANRITEAIMKVKDEAIAIQGSLTRIRDQLLRLRMVPTVNQVVNHAAVAQSKLHSVFTFRLPLKTKLKVYGAYVRSHLTYAAPAWLALGSYTRPEGYRSSRTDACD